jgi:catechol 2,3-dioxygenase-like lactoylglutathione lyase family enzyme
VKATSLNHVSVHAEDLDTSAAFYREFFGMTELPTPDFGYPVRWLRLGALQVHLFQLATPAPKHHHFAVNVDDYEAAFLEAKRRGILDGGPRALPDGSVQLYIRDPSGNRIELDWPDGYTLDPDVFGKLPVVPGDPRATLFLDR